MNRCRILLYALTVPGFFCGSYLCAQSAVLGRMTADGQVKFERVDDLQINQSKKIRLAAANSPRVEPADAKSLERVETSQAGFLRGDGEGRIFRVNPDGSRDRVIPENFPLKMSIQPATTPIELSIGVVKNKRDKDVNTITAKEFYFYDADADAEHVALRFVLSPKSFASRDEQLHAVSGLAASFQNEPLGAELCKSLETQLQSALKDFDEGGPFDSLLGTRKLATVAHQGFPSNAGVTQASLDVEGRIRTTLATKQSLLGLAEIGDWGTFRTVYRNIEVSQDSFPELKALHRRALEEETRERCERARALITRHQDSSAMRELSAAALLDPGNPEIPKLAESTRMQAADAEAKRTRSSRKTLPSGSPEDRRFRKAIFEADHAIQYHDYPRAEAAIKEAERENAEAPQILLAEASLAASGDEIASAIPLLDRYDRIVTEAADREKGDAVRNQVMYELRKREQEHKAAIEAATAKGDFSTVYSQSKAALKGDPENADVLFSAGVSAAVLRKGTEAKELLKSYLQDSDSLAGDDEKRSEARKLIRAVDSKIETGSGTPNWFSGYPVASGVYYCPRSLAFQIPIESVSGFKFRMNYLRDEHGRLKAIQSQFEDEKGRLDYKQIATKANQELPDSQIGNFFFAYDRTLPVVRTVYAGKAPTTSPDEGSVMVVKNEANLMKLVDQSGSPLIALDNNPWVDLKVVNLIMGPAATIVSGNSFFNPFIWDGVHYFTVTYDEQGRASSAQEWGLDNLVRFQWNGERLIVVSAFHAREKEPYYRRVISYSGLNIESEEYKSGSHSGRIKYLHPKDVLTAAKMEDGGVHDGKTWQVRMAERN